MKFIYIDEAGNTGSNLKDPDQPIHLIGGLAIDDFKIQALSEKLEEIAEWTVKQLQEKGQNYAAQDIEFHGAELFGGRKKFQSLAPETRRTICVHIIKACQDAKIDYFTSAVRKNLLSQVNFKKHPHIFCFANLVFYLNYFLKKENTLGLLIADQCQETEKDILKLLKSYQNHSKTIPMLRKRLQQTNDTLEKKLEDSTIMKEFYKKLKRDHDNLKKEFEQSIEITKELCKRNSPETDFLCENIIDTVHFIKSDQNRLVQACDILTYFRLKHYLLSDEIRQLRDKKNLEQNKELSADKHLLNQSKQASFSLGEEIIKLDRSNFFKE